MQAAAERGAAVENVNAAAASNEEEKKDDGADSDEGTMNVDNID